MDGGIYYIVSQNHGLFPLILNHRRPQRTTRTRSIYVKNDNLLTVLLILITTEYMGVVFTTWLNCLSILSILSYNLTMIAMTIHLNFAWNSNAVFCRWPVCFGGSLSMLFKNSHAGDRILLHEQLLFISCLKIACSKMQHPYHEYMRIIMSMAYACIPCCFTVKHLLTNQDPIFHRWQVFGASNTINTGRLPCNRQISAVVAENVKQLVIVWVAAAAAAADMCTFTERSSNHITYQHYFSIKLSTKYNKSQTLSCYAMWNKRINSFIPTSYSTGFETVTCCLIALNLSKSCHWN